MLFAAKMKNLTGASKVNKDGITEASIKVTIELDYSEHVMKALAEHVKSGILAVTIEPYQLSLLAETGEAAIA